MNSTEMMSEQELKERICGSITATMLSATNAELKAELYKRTIPSIRSGIWSAINNYTFNRPEHKGRAIDEINHLISNSTVDIITRISDWNNDGPLGAWAFRIGYNNTLNFINKWTIRNLWNALDLDAPISIGTEVSGSTLSDIIPDRTTTNPEIELITKELILKITDFILNCSSALVAHTVSLIANGEKRSISGVAISLGLYPYEIKKEISPYLKEIREFMTNNPDIRRELCRKEREAHSKGQLLFPLREFPPLAANF